MVRGTTIGTWVQFALKQQNIGRGRAVSSVPSYVPVPFDVPRTIWRTILYLEIFHFVTAVHLSRPYLLNSIISLSFNYTYYPLFFKPPDLKKKKRRKDESKGCNWLDGEMEEEETPRNRPRNHATTQENALSTKWYDNWYVVRRLVLGCSLP